MNIQIRVRGAKKVGRFLFRLPQQLKLQTGKKAEEFMKAVQKSAKLRAPRWTGALAQSIKYFRKDSQFKIIVDSPYGLFQEFGFAPHFVGLDTPTGSGFVVADWTASKGMMGWHGSLFVSHNKPFIMPALEKNVAKLHMLLQQGADTAVINSRR